MRPRLTSFLFAVTVLGGSVPREASAALITVDLEDRPLSADSFDNGSDLAGGFTSRGAFFNNEYSTTFGAWRGWSYSNVNNTTAAGFANQYAAITGAGVGGSGIYGVAFDQSPGDSVIDLPAGTSPVSVFVTNTTYAYLSMLNGDRFARKFTTGDFFKLSITGSSGPGGTGTPLGVVDFSLANYNSPDDRPVDTWSLVDLAPLVGSQSLSFGMSSSDNGTFGMNTPAFFALDNLTVSTAVVPEPGGLVLLASGMLGVAIHRVRRRWVAKPSR